MGLLGRVRHAERGHAPQRVRPAGPAGAAGAAGRRMGAGAARRTGPLERGPATRVVPTEPVCRVAGADLRLAAALDGAHASLTRALDVSLPRGDRRWARFWVVANPSCADVDRCRGARLARAARPAAVDRAYLRPTGS